MVDTKWLKLLLSASIAWTEGGEGVQKAQNESSPHIVGPERSMTCKMMLSKALKVAIERVEATPLRWPLALHDSETFLCPCMRETA